MLVMYVSSCICSSPDSLAEFHLDASVMFQDLTIGNPYFCPFNSAIDRIYNNSVLVFLLRTFSVSVMGTEYS